MLKGREKVLGVGQRRRYDLPLNKGVGFLKLLIVLMTVLVLLACAASFALSAMKARWTSGLENRATVELPAQDKNGVLLNTESHKALMTDIAAMLKAAPGVQTVDVMREEDIQKLVSPWLGEDLGTDIIPLPGLIAIRFQRGVEIPLSLLEGRLGEIAPQARLDTHQSWLRDVLRFAGALQFAAVTVLLVIGLTTLVAVAGAVRSRIAEYHEDVELLHLMGASDTYITRQFQRYTFIQGLQGAIAGACVGALILLCVGWMSAKMDISMIPDFHLTSAQKMLLASLPVLIAVLAALTSRWTVLRVLARMP